MVSNSLCNKLQGIAELINKINTPNNLLIKSNLMEKKRTGDLMEMPGMKETVVQMAKVNGARWPGHVLRRDDGQVLRKALEFDVKGKRKWRWPKKTWKTQVEKESKSVGLEKEDALNRARWRVGVGEIAVRVG